MPYVFPKRALKPQDVLDPVELNEDFVPAAEVASGKLNAHNIDATVKQEIYTDGSTKTAYYNAYGARISSDPQFGSPGSYSAPSRTGSDVHVLSNDTSWDKITDMELSIPTGVSNLWLIGHVQYIWIGFQSIIGSHFWSEAGVSGSSTDGSVSRNSVADVALPCRVQFAFRVDGNVLSDTITGEFDPYLRTVFAVRPVRSRDISSRLPGSSSLATEQPTGLGPEVFPVRLGTTISVSPGTHTVEIVARRLPSLKQASYDGVYGAGTIEPNVIAVFNRKILALDLPVYPGTLTSGSAVDTTAFDAEDLASPQDSVDSVRDRLNSVATGSLSRGALAHYHLPSAVIQKSQFTITGGSASLSAKYPGWGATTTLASSKNGTGWWGIRDASGNQLKTDNASAFSISEPCLFLIMANIQVSTVREVPGSRTPGQFASLALGYKTASTEAILTSSESYLNHYAILHKYTGFDSSGAAEMKAFAENADVALFTYVFSSELPADVNYFAVYGSTMEALGGGSQVNLTTGYGNIVVIQLKV